MRFAWLIVCSIVLASITGCGGGSGSPAGDRITSLSISPTMAIVRPNGTRAFIFQLQGTGTPNPGVVWSADTGTIDNNGVYVANGAGSTAHVTVKSVFDPTRSATATVTVSDTAGPAFSIDASTVSTLTRRFFTLTTGGTIDLGALIKVVGTANTGITWSVVTPNGGSISSSGVYRAPSVNGNYLIQFAATADPTQTDYVYAVVGPIASLPVTGTISISSPIGVNGLPLSDLRVGTRYRFGYTLSVQNSTDVSVTWSANNGASIGADGSFTATVPGQYKVTVTSVAAGVSASAVVTVK